MDNDPRISRLIGLGKGALAAPPGRGRIALALLMGFLCHGLFAAAILSMMHGMFLGLSSGIGEVPYPWAIATNLLLIVQFPLVHSLLLTGPGGRFLASLMPPAYGRTLGTTSYAIIASLQLLMLFWLWTPSGVVWWQAEGAWLYAVGTLYALAYAFLAKAVFDAGVELQSGALGWLSLLAQRAPRFPDMPTLGLFGRLRQPIYLAFACTLWTVPTWTPDQLALALAWTAYCVLAPLLKERRFRARYGERWQEYEERVPYMVPHRAGKVASDAAPSA